MLKTGEKTSEVFYKNFVGGVAWALGATVGFTLLVGLVGFLVNKLGGLPVIGAFLASLVEVTQTALERRGLTF